MVLAELSVDKSDRACLPPAGRRGQIYERQALPDTACRRLAAIGKETDRLSTGQSVRRFRSGASNRDVLPYGSSRPAAPSGLVPLVQCSDIGKKLGLGLTRGKGAAQIFGLRFGGLAADRGVAVQIGRKGIALG